MHGFRRSFFCALLLLCGLELPASAQLPTATPAKKDEMRIPEDGTNWYTVVLIHPMASQDSIDKRLLESFSSTSALASLKRQTRFSVIETNHPHYERFKEWKRMPAVLVMRGEEGEVVFQDSGPKVGHHLAHRIQCAICKRCPNGNCNPIVPHEEAEPTPEPVDVVQPKPDPDPEPVPEPEPMPPAIVQPPAKRGLRPWQLGLISGLTVAIYCGIAFVKDMRDQS